MTDSERLLDAVRAALEGLKALDLRVIDVRGLTTITDYMVIASGTSDRHVRSLAGRVVAAARELDVRPLGTEGEREGEWILVDLEDVVVHVMLSRARDFYQLERLWSMEDDTIARRTKTREQPE
ncbi:MAG: ribosome silencing factor [Chromatiales bacterium 21-64-14]|nr:MAG: ribosome silencing factor [Chromatiales bacterium 21-64-14]HQU14965.1 ribosome silencing factor [Gammaproteobacteria bacterium]